MKKKEKVVSINSIKKYSIEDALRDVENCYKEAIRQKNCDAMARALGIKFQLLGFI